MWLTNANAVLNHALNHAFLKNIFKRDLTIHINLIKSVMFLLKFIGRHLFPELTKIYLESFPNVSSNCYLFLLDLEFIRKLLFLFHQ